MQFVVKYEDNDSSTAATCPTERTHVFSVATQYLKCKQTVCFVLLEHQVSSHDTAAVAHRASDQLLPSNDVNSRQTWHKKEF